MVKKLSIINELDRLESEMLTHFNYFLKLDSKQYEATAAPTIAAKSIRMRFESLLKSVGKKDD